MLLSKLLQSDWYNVGCAGAFLTLTNLKFDLLAIIERRIARDLDLGVMDEQVFAAVIGSDEAVAFVAIEPFYCACAHTVFS